MRWLMIVFFGLLSLHVNGTAMMAQDSDSQDPSASQSPTPDPTPEPTFEPTPEPATPTPQSEEPTQTPTPTPTSEPVKTEKPQPMALAMAKAFPRRNVFVGDEPVTLTYVILMRTGVVLEDESFRFADTSPFKAVSVTVGNRIAVQNAKDIDRQQVEAILRLDKNVPYGVYRVPKLAVRYTYDDIATGEDGKFVRSRRKGVVYAEAVSLKKVPLYVETDTLHEKVHIGDPITLRLSIHADMAAEILNEIPPEQPKQGITYLSTFSLKQPFVVLRNEREESVTSAYRVLTYRYTYSILDIQPKPYAVPVPPVLWRLRTGKESGEVKTIAPDPTLVVVHSILEPNTRLEPPKGVLMAPVHERMVFFTFPLAAAAAMSFGLLVWGSYRLVWFLRTRKKKKQSKAQAAHDAVVRDPVYESSAIDRWWRLPRALKRAKKQYNDEPNEKNCALLRHLLARYAVSRLKGDRRIDRDKACSMTAADLRAVGDFPELPLIRKLESCLETCKYDKVQDSRVNI